jgi:SpoVK/Ycf46/Vps4 family AAA+-type ATPase
MTGLASVKHQVRLLAAEARAGQLRRDAGLPAGTPSRHMIFTGPPGTAKTAVARLIAAIYAQLGLLSSGHLIEVTRADLIGRYIGETAPRVTLAVASALGGVLFILALSNSPNDYGPEAIATLLKLMEDHRGDLVVIAAGYEHEMHALLQANPGQASRFPRTVHFPAYTDEQLAAIFASMTRSAGLQLADGTTAKLRAILAATPRGKNFGNARHVRNLLEQAMSAQAVRITRARRRPRQNTNPARRRSARGLSVRPRQRPRPVPVTASSASGRRDQVVCVLLPAAYAIQADDHEDGRRSTARSGKSPGPAVSQTVTTTTQKAREPLR